MNDQASCGAGTSGTNQLCSHVQTGTMPADYVS